MADRVGRKPRVAQPQRQSAKVRPQPAAVAKPKPPPKQPPKPPPKQKTNVGRSVAEPDDDEAEEAGELLGDEERRMLQLVQRLEADNANCEARIRRIGERLGRTGGAVRRLENRWASSQLWRVGNFRESLAEARAGRLHALHSHEMCTARHGYCFALLLSLNGDGQARGSFMSLHVTLRKGPFDGLLNWPFNMRIYLSLLDQTDDDKPREHITKLLIPNVCKENSPFIGRPLSECNPPFGIVEFASHAQLLRSGRHYVRDDAIFIRAEPVANDLVAD